MSQNIFHNTGRTGSFIENLDKGGELTSFEAEKMLKIVRHMATKRTQLNPNRLGSLWVGCLRLYSLVLGSTTLDCNTSHVKSYKSVAV